MKKEFEKRGNVMQLNELKYDPLYAYIDRISFTVKRLSGGMTNCEEIDDDGRPIPTIAGYIGIGSKAGTRGNGGLRNYKTGFPETLRVVAAEDEKEIDQFIMAHKLDYLIHEGGQKFKELGNGVATFPKEYIQKSASQVSGLTIKPDGTLAVKDELGSIKLFVNNEVADRASIGKINVNQLYSVIEKSQYNPARNESFTSALLLYVTEDN